MDKVTNITSVVQTQRGDYPEQWQHHPVGFLIRSTKDFIVHIDKDGRLDWETTREFDKKIESRSEAQRLLLSEIKGEICLAEAAQLEGYSEEIKHHYLCLLGEALVHWIEGDASTSKKMLNGAAAYLRDRNEETSRRWYLFNGINSAGLFCILGILSWLFRERMVDILGVNGFMLLLAACFGALGAMFSIIMRSGNLKFSANAGRKLHVLEASSRISAGAISAIVVFLAIKSELVFGTVLRGTGGSMFLFMATLVAGAGERLATSIISRFDDSAVDLPATPNSEKG